MTNSTIAEPAVAATTTPSNEKDKFIVLYEGEEYEISDFLDNHPAGKLVLIPYRNKDLTQKFLEVGHSDEAKKILRKHKVNKTAEDIAFLEKTKGKSKTAFNLSKLFTHEDKFFVHKFFGFFALASFAYRYFYCLPVYGNLQMDGSWIDYATLAMHFMLSSSSLIFHVIEHRIPTRPLIIYEEYRLHAIVFTCRAIGVSLVGFLCNDLDSLAKRCLLAGLILGIHLLADYITRVYGAKGVTAVRNDGVMTFQYIGLFYSYYQMAALGAHLVWNDRLGDLGYNSLIAIQSSAFLMTLKRKNMIRWYSHAFWYSAALALSYFVMWKSKGYEFFIYSAMVFFVRVKFNISKYILWGLYTVSMYYFNQA